MMDIHDIHDIKEEEQDDDHDNDHDDDYIPFQDIEPSLVKQSVSLQPTIAHSLKRKRKPSIQRLTFKIHLSLYGEIYCASCGYLIYSCRCLLNGCS